MLIYGPLNNASKLIYVMDKNFFTMLGEAFGGISCVYDLWVQYEGRRWEASTRRRREALVVSMVGGPVGAVTPPNTSKIRSHKFIAISFM